MDLANCGMEVRYQSLMEAQWLIRNFVAKIRAATSEKDRILRGNGVDFPPARNLGRWVGSRDVDIQHRVDFLEKTLCRAKLVIEGVEMPLDPTDRVSHAKADGTVVKENIPAFVSSGKVITWDTSLPLEVGDHLLRQLPNGFVEDFIVDDPSYFSDVGGIGAHFQVKVHRSGMPAALPSTIINNITGDHARVNIQSVDASRNRIVQNDMGIFKELAAAIHAGVNSEEQDAILERLMALEKAAGTPSFKDQYQEFISSAANHITIIAPFIPALTKMLSSY